MNTRKWLITSGTVALAALVMLALAVGLTQAQGPEPPEGENSVEGPMDVATIAPGAIPIQGRLTDASGNPLDGTYNLTFRLYEASSGGTALCSDTNSVSVDNGLFSTYMDHCYNDLHGQKVWLGIEVGSDGEMTPRQIIYPVPYALTLKPGAVISTTSWPALHVETTNPSGRALRAYASATSGANYGVVGASKSPDGYGGYFYNNSDAGGTGLHAWSEASVGLEGYSYEIADHPGVFGCSAASASTCDPYRDDGPAGVMGYGQFGVYGIGTSNGIYGTCGTSFGYGGFFKHSDGGLALVADSTAANNDDI